MELAPEDRNWTLTRIVRERAREAKAIERAGRKGV